MTKAVRQEQLDALLLGLLPAGGSPVANGQLLSLWTQAAADAGLLATTDDFASLREDLVVRGLVVKGKGRGGSTARTPAAAPGSDSFALEGEAAATADEAGAAGKTTAKPPIGKPSKPGKPKAGAADAGEAAQVLSYRHPDRRKNNPEVGLVSASVVWTSGDLFGCRFDEPLTPAALAAAELRSLAPPEAGTPVRADPPDDLGTRLQRLRKERGLTLAQVAGQLGVSKPTVWAWERGRARPIEERIDALAEALGVTRSELMAIGETSGALRDLVARSREQIAAAFGTRAENVRIMIEL